MKDLEELRHLSGFIRTDKAPGGVWCIDEKPDMWMPTEHGILGVEHTRIVRGQLRAEENYKREAVCTAQHLFEESGGPDLQLWVRFRNEYVAKSDVEAVARAIADVVGRNTPRPGERMLLEMWRFPPDVRPPKVSEIDISHWKKPTDSFWSISLGGAVPRLAPKKIQEVIEAKEDRLPAYRSRCSTVWLLIAIDGFSPSGWWNIQQNVVNTRYHTDFERVILYEHFGRRSFTIVDACSGDADGKAR